MNNLSTTYFILRNLNSLYLNWTPDRVLKRDLGPKYSIKRQTAIPILNIYRPMYGLMKWYLALCELFFNGVTYNRDTCHNVPEDGPWYRRSGVQIAAWEDSVCSLFTLLAPLAWHLGRTIGYGGGLWFFLSFLGRWCTKGFSPPNLLNMFIRVTTFVWLKKKKNLYPPPPVSSGSPR